MESSRRRNFSPLRVRQWLAGVWGATRVVGLSSAFWFAWYQLQLRTGWIRSQTRSRSWHYLQADLGQLSATETKKKDSPFFFTDIEAITGNLQTLPLQKTVESERITAGDFRLWEDGYFHFGMPPNWNLNPLTGIVAAGKRHWMGVLENSTGDVKGVWELSRFSVAFHLAREYARTRDEHIPDLFWQLFESWLVENPPEEGVQWRSGQEVALRSMAWTFALRVFIHSSATTSARLLAMKAALAEHARRIEATTAYARAQWNNHLISEGAGLWTIGLLFPELHGADRWRKLGRSLLRDAAAQFFPDGGYLQHSHNYHRLAIHLMIWAMRLGEATQQPFPAVMYERLRDSLHLLRPMANAQTGCIPNFGSNDGALFLPLTGCAYEDYRPVLQTLSIWLTGRKTFDPGPWDEESIWLLGLESFPAGEPDPIPSPARASALYAGLFWMRGKQSRMGIRCVEFHSRPGHADQLHTDLWFRGINIALDPGTYLYGGEPPWQNGFTHAGVHNTITIDGQDQMIRSGRFRWSSVAQGRGSFRDENTWTGEHDGYRRLGVTHRRSVTHTGEDQWVIRDELAGRGLHRIRLHWLIPDWPWEWMDISSKERFADQGSGPWGGVRLTQTGQTIRLLIRAGNEAAWSLVRAGELLHGVEESDAPVPQAVRGWHSTRYASKSAALSLVCTVSSVLPKEITSIWICESDDRIPAR